MSAQREGVGDEGEAEEVQMLAGMSDTVGAPEPEGVFEGAVDRFCIVAASEETCEVGVAGRDGPEVFSAVEPAGCVVGGCVQPDRDGAAAVAVGELVVVVPAVSPALVLGPVCSDSPEFGEGEVAGVGAFGDSERPGVGVEVEGASGAVGKSDGLVFDVGALLDASAAGATVGFAGGDGGGDRG